MVHANECVRVATTKLGLAQRDSALQLGNGKLVVVETCERRSDGRSDRRFHERLVLKTLIDLRSSAAQHFPHCQVWVSTEVIAELRCRGYLLKEVRLHETSDGLGDGCIRLCLLLRGAGQHGLPGAHCRGSHKG